MASQTIANQLSRPSRFRRGTELLEDRRLLAGDLFFDLDDDRSSDGRAAIIGGQLALPDDWPWMVSIQDNSFGSATHSCGGALVTADAIVTAAHCVEGESVRNLSARIGGGALDSTSALRAPIGEIILHPDYESFTNDADIAILLLESPVENATLPILRSGQGELAATGVQATALGWGATREGGRLQNNLHEVSVPIVSNAVANLPESYDGQITSNMLAAGDEAGGRDSCQGDSGGPLVVSDEDGQHLLAGIVSWGEGCALPDKYGIYTRVTAFSSWIDDIVGAGPAGFVNFTQERYADGSRASIRLQDSDLADVESFNVVLSSDSGDVETVRLTAFDKGRFEGAIDIAISDVVAENSVLNANGGESIQVEYLDQDDGTGMSVVVMDIARIVEDDFSNNRDDAPLIDTSSSIRGDIEVSRDVDWFQFEAQAGRGYEITVTLDGSLNDSVVAVYDVDGTSVLGFDDDGGRGLGSQLVFVPSQSGIRFIEVTGFDTNVGTYLLRIDEINPPIDDHANGVDGATVAAIGEILSGAVDQSSDSDWFVFDAEEGVSYDVDAILGSLVDSQLRLYDTDGRTELAFNDDATFFTTASRIHWRAETSGRYYVELSGFEGATGTYQVLIDESFDDHANDARDATRIDVTTDLSSEFGFVDNLNVDWFVFAATADKFYEIRTVEVTLQDSILSIFDSGGTNAIVVNDDRLNSTMSRIVWQPEVTGDYFIEVAAFDQDAGDYRLDVRELAVPPVDDFGNRAVFATPVDVNTSSSGSIQYEADVDWLSFVSVAGRTYEFEIELGTLSDSLLALYDEDGRTLIDQNDDIFFEFDEQNRASRIEWVADASGTHFLEVSGFDGERGSYSLTTMVDTEPGDLNTDGRLDSADIDLLFSAVREGTNDSQFDLNGDERVDDEDVELLLVRLATIPGDGDLDGLVGFSDFLSLSRAFGEPGGWGQGDFDGDGQIAFSDFLTLANRFGDRFPG